MRRYMHGNPLFYDPMTSQVRGPAQRPRWQAQPNLILTFHGRKSDISWDRWSSAISRVLPTHFWIASCIVPVDLESPLESPFR